MDLSLLRYSSQEDDTLGLLFIDGRFACYTLEDEYREVKVPGETRIPAGTYDVRLRREGGFHNRYSKLFAEIHLGMLELVGVPGFQYILLHVGNRADDSAGCILVGDQAHQNITENGYVGPSVAAYRRIYPPIAAALEAGERVRIGITDYA